MSTTDPAKLARRIAADAAVLPRMIEAWLADVRLAMADGFGVGRSTDHGPRPVNAISDPTGEQAAHNTTGTGAGYGPSDEHALVLETLTVIVGSFDVLKRFTARRDIHHGVTQACSGGHLPGAAIPRSNGGWHDATCTNPAELYRREDGGYALRREGLCTACARRYHRWRSHASDVTEPVTRATCDDG